MQKLKKLNIFGHRPQNLGLPPGSLISSSPPREDVSISVFTYNQQEYREQIVASVGDITVPKDGNKVAWVNIDGISRVDILRDVGKRFEVHDLVLEDILNVEQRPKIEDHHNYLFVVIKMIYPGAEPEDVVVEHIGIIVTRNCVITFQEQPGDVFDPIRERIRNSQGRIRRTSADYLMYALMDAIVDNYYLLLERFGDRFESLEKQALEASDDGTIGKIHSLRSTVIMIRKALWPLREQVHEMVQSEYRMVNENTYPYIRDLYDHIVQVIETLETFRDVLSGLLDTYLSSASNRMNEVMKVLTMIATIFIPLSFIAGLYGMNFEVMPELKKPWAYPVVLGVMALVAVAMILFFRKKKWL